jgi:hypothetical protein
MNCQEVSQDLWQAASMPFSSNRAITCQNVPIPNKKALRIHKAFFLVVMGTNEK